METQLLPSMEQVEQTLGYDCTRITEIQNELDSLSSQYLRYLDLRRQLQQHLERVKKVAMIVGPKAFKDGLKKAGLKKIKLDNLPDESVALWEMIHLHLSFVDEAKISDLLAFLESMGRPGISRQAIESSLRTHQKRFQVRKKGKERYISLKRRKGIKSSKGRFDDLILEMQGKIVDHVGPDTAARVWKYMVDPASKKPNQTIMDALMEEDK